MASVATTATWLFNALDVIGTVAFAISGAMVAVRQKMDWFGVVVLGVIAAVGGGTIRDLLLPQTPVSWVDDPWPLALATATALLVIPLVTRIRRQLDDENVVLAADAAGLAVFTVLGTQAALTAGVTLPMAATLGAVSGIGGGVLRDVLAGQVPVVLTGRIHAVAALLGAALFVWLADAEANIWVAVWIPVVVIFALRGTALWRDWSLPSVDVDLKDPDGD